LIGKGLVKRVTGYKLGRSVDELEVGEVDIWGDEVLVWLI
jgi:hypothetical protein